MKRALATVYHEIKKGSPVEIQAGIDDEAHSDASRCARALGKRWNACKFSVAKLGPGHWIVEGDFSELSDASLVQGFAEGFLASRWHWER